MVSIVNLNEYVWVELTEYGWNSIEEFYKRLFYIPSVNTDVTQHVRQSMTTHKNNTKNYIIEGNEVNLTMFQLHELMNLLGEKMYCGASQTIVGNKVYFNVN